ncbi:hypothetical protein CCAX7_17650 [Capsulimonas corticalis]|uniref:Uncharacterized protein n=1 Tax=Capsulimonas corticalis TaxID=2219043 RepID=A0A402D3W4_9BACT|nr:helix-turn-helix transcriptional regulator [Capsulimonas corticalis]BDI29714.1 hypothetical protein CCAX7_17650 [Capsulimonas corticalis]
MTSTHSETSLTICRPTDCGVAIYPPGASFGPRAMRDYEFVWTIEGDARYRWGDQEADAPAGSLVLCRPGATDFFQWDRHRRTRHAYVHFLIEPQAGQAPSPDTWPLVRALPEDDIIRPLFRHLLTWHGRAGDAQFALTVTQILNAYLTDTMAVGALGREEWPPAVEAAFNFVSRALEADPAQPLTLTQLAGAAHVTPEHLCRLFKSSIGLSPAAMVRLARLDYAASLLSRTNYSVGEISALAGFANPFHFARLFREAFGHTATELRRAVREGEAPPLPRVLWHTHHLDSHR